MRVQQGQWRAFWSWPLLVAVLFLAYGAGVCAFAPGPGATRSLWIAMGGLPISVLTILMAGRHVLRTHRLNTDRASALGWFVFAVGSALSSLIELLWALQPLESGRIDLPSAISLIWLGANPLAVGAALLLLRASRGVSAGFVVDCLGGTAASVLMLWSVISYQIEISRGASLASQIVLTGYPALGTVSVFATATLVGLGASNRRERLALVLMAAAIAVGTLTAVLLITDILRGAYVPGNWYECGPAVGHLLALLALGYRVKASPDGAQAPTTIGPLGRAAQVLTPYVFAATTTITIAGGEMAGKPQTSPVLVLGSAALTAAVLFRQALALLENRRLTDALRRAGETLEADVTRRTEQLAQRTDQLTSLHDLLVSVNDSLEETSVLRAALLHTRNAFRADVVAVWQCQPTAPDSLRLFRVDGLDGYPAWKRRVERLRRIPALPIRSVRHGRDPLYVRFAPLVSQHQTLGMIGVARWDADFSESDETLFSTMGRAIGGALHNVRRYAAARAAADRDPMTGLLNHRAIHDRLQTTLANATQRGTTAAVLMIDVNDFKLFNDTYGHPVGDRVIQTVARILSEISPSYAHLGRYGGDEFFVALEGADRTVAQAYALVVQERVSSTPIRMDNADIPVPVSISVGVAVFPDDSRKAMELLAHADSNLYQAKFGHHQVVGRQRQLLFDTDDPSYAVFDAMITAIDNKDRYTRRHSEDVAEYALWLGDSLSLTPAARHALRLAGLLHDIGKIGVPDELLRKPGFLEPDEFETMQRHPVTGALIVSAMPGMSALVPGIRTHHERWDGKGYPDGLGSDRIPLFGRILAIADAFSAMTTDRPYRRSKTFHDALEEIAMGAGTQFDPELARLFVATATARADIRQTA